MADANGSKNFGKLGVPALIAGAALLVPFAWARTASAATKGKPPRLARAMPGKGKRQRPAVVQPEPEAAPAPTPAPAAEADAPPVVAPAAAVPAAPAAPPTAPAALPTPAPAAVVKPDPVPTPPAPPPVKLPDPPVAQPMPAPGRTAPGDGPTPLHQWLLKHSTPDVRERVRAALQAANISLPFDQAERIKLCQIAVDNLPGETLDKLEEDHPEMKAELALCERKAAEQKTKEPAPAPPTAPPVPEATAPAPPAAPPVDVSTSTAPAPVPTPAPAPAPPVAAPTPAPAPAPEATPPTAPADPVPTPPAPPPVAPGGSAVVPAAPAAAQLAAPKPPAGFDAAKARQLAPQLAKSVTDKKYDYSRGLAKEFQIAAGINVDKHYGGETRSAVEAFGVRRPPPALFKPTGAVPYKWADYV